MFGRVRDLAALIFHALFFLIYLVLFCYTDVNNALLKGGLYLIMALELMYLYKAPQNQFNNINHLTFIVNFLIIFITLFGIKNGLLLMAIYSGSIVAVSLMILTSGLKHGIFKD